MTRIALAAALLMSTATIGLAENSTPAKRYSTSAAAGAMQSTPVRAGQSRQMSTPNNLMMNVMDRASSPFACGG